MPSREKRHRIQPRLREHAASIRHEPTEPERQLWQLLRKSRLGGLKFRRQAVIADYIVDFCCPARKLVVEVDGESHVGRAARDEVRTRSLKELGYRVVRVTNDDVLGDIEAVGMMILRAVEDLPSDGNAPTPLPPP